MWGEPTNFIPGDVLPSISTHSPRVGRTAKQVERELQHQHFNSLAPCGANRSVLLTPLRQQAFQLTRPVWGEPVLSMSNMILKRISTHSPRVGRTHCACRLIARQCHISTHSPRVGRTCTSIDINAPPFHFNSLAPCGANPMGLILSILTAQFQLTRPVWGEPSTPRLFRALTTFQLTRPVWGEPCPLVPIL